MRKVACIVPYNSQGEILLQKKDLDYFLYPGGWTFFGGLIGPGEKKIDAANRELEEEIGKEIANTVSPNLKFLFSRPGVSPKGEGQIMSLYLVALERKDLKYVRIGEGAGIAFFAEKEVVALDINPDAKVFIEEIFSYVKEKVPS
jgi:8-oxo-dGTP pyrophosphatase MutT (NUDIX family)